MDIAGIDQEDVQAKNDLADLLMKNNIKGYLLTPRAVEIGEQREEAEDFAELEVIRARTEAREKEKVKAYETKA